MIDHRVGTSEVLQYKSAALIAALI